jgi:hypothetical protein
MIYGADPSQPVPSNFTEYGVRKSRATQEAHNIPDITLLGLSLDDVVDLITEKHAAPPVEIDYDRKSASFRDPWAQPLPGPVYVKELAIYFPATGCANAMWNRGLPISGRTSGQEFILAFSYSFTSDELSSVSDSRYRELIFEAVDKTQALHETINKEIASQGNLLRHEVQSVVEPRWRGLRALHQATSELGIPNASPRTPKHIPLERRKLSFEQLAAASDRESEYVLSQLIADDLIDLIINFGSSLEVLLGTSNKLAESGETTIRDMILNSLSFIYKAAATGETFQGRGKADIVLRWKNRNAFIAECKIWDGSSKFSEAIDQLLGRYTVWRDIRVALILFIRDRRDITSIIESAAACITSHERFLEAIQAEDPYQRRDYLISAVNDDLRRVRLSFLPIVIPNTS